MRHPITSDGLQWPPHGRDNSSRWVDPSQTRTKGEYPYSYDEFFIIGNRDAIKDANGEYSDRLWQLDRDKAVRFWAMHCKGRWPEQSLANLSKFLTAYHGKNIRAVALAEGCNQGNGYPYWIVWWRVLP